MKKKFYILSMLILLSIVTYIAIGFSKDKATLKYEDGSLLLEMSFSNSTTTIYPWLDEKENVYYFFLPSHMKDFPIRLDSALAEHFFIEEDVLTENVLTYDESLTYYFTSDSTGKMPLKFLCSAKLPSLFVTLESGSIDYLHENKDHYVSGSVLAMNSTGKVEYNNSMESISGRGNSTWDFYFKKPYSLKLTDSTALFGLEPSAKWNLLANWRDASKLQNKIAFDIAGIMDMEFTPRATWVDLYIDGNYAGNYLLTSPISVGEDNINIYDLGKENEALNPSIETAAPFQTATTKGVDINNDQNLTGGYLIEKDFEEYYNSGISGFKTNSNAAFSISSPKYASKSQIEYISSHIQKIEDMILSQDEQLSQYLDLKSYAGKCIVDEISLNYDTGVTSSYFYKHRNNDILYSGPIWDYDFAFGIPYTNYNSENWTDYTRSLVECDLVWNRYLYNNPVFVNEFKQIYTGILPELESLINHKIDTYADTVSKSLILDRMRWKNYVYDGMNYFNGHYLSYESNIEYLKYFIINRINYLIDHWDIDYPYLSYSPSKETHTVSFVMDDKIAEEITIQHGESIQQLPSLEGTIYTEWCLMPRIETYSEYLPILEDTTIIAQ